jgi:hypothetical protein
MYHYFRDLLPLLVIGGSFTLTGAVLYGAWLLGRYRGREDELPMDLAEMQARLQRLEYVIAQNANALERLEAAHRHTARLITDGPSTLPRLPGQQVTPH